MTVGLDILTKTIQLSTNMTMPMVGLGTWKLTPPHLKLVLERAIELGCRHVDCAAIYENEHEIGNVLDGILNNNGKFGVGRKDLFIVSKLWNTKHARQDVIKACEQTLKDLKLSYLDLYIIHWPFSFQSDERGYSKMDENGVAVVNPIPLTETWQAMEDLVRMGKVRMIGVSNFTTRHLNEILQVARIPPVVNQVELHPLLPQTKLFQFCQTNGIQVVAYSSLGSGKSPSLLLEPKVVEVASELGMSPAQVLLSWAITRGIAVIPKTGNPERLVENFSLKLLDAESMRKLNDISKGGLHRFINPVEFWKHDCFVDE